jgi:hypothetical protein
MRLGNRLAKLEREARARPPRGQFKTIEAIPVSYAEGRTPGLFPAGSPGSTAGILVYDPAEGLPLSPRVVWLPMDS